MLRFHKTYFLLSLLLFLMEVLIALYAHDRFIRPYVGDVLVVILLYCLVQTVLAVPSVTIAIAVLLFAYLTEISQYLHVLHYLGWEHSPTARLLIGSSFSWIDLLCYTTGIAIVLITEQRFANKKTNLFSNKPYFQ